jgi:type III restriction enzyme
VGTTIINPVINGPYDEPRQHFKFDDGITDEIALGRRHSEYFVPEGGTYPGLLLLHDVTERSMEKITHAIVAADERAERLLPVFDADREGSTDWVDFDTTRPAHVTDSARCHVSHVVVDSGWELTVSTVLEDLPGVAAYVKNDHLGFTIPYTYEGRGFRYVPDFLARLADPGDGLVRTLLIEVSGGAKKHHSPGPVSEKADTARHLWVPAVNRHGQWGRWGFVEVGDPASARTPIAQACAELAGSATVLA